MWWRSVVVSERKGIIYSISPFFSWSLLCPPPPIFSRRSVVSTYPSRMVHFPLLFLECYVRERLKDCRGQRIENDQREGKEESSKSRSKSHLSLSTTYIYAISLFFSILFGMLLDIENAAKKGRKTFMTFTEGRRRPLSSQETAVKMEWTTTRYDDSEEEMMIMMIYFYHHFMFLDLF